MLFQGDCMELLGDIPDGSVDLVLTDPPFGVTSNAWDRVPDLKALWRELHRVAKQDAAFVLHCQQPFTTDLIASNRREFKYLWYWYKHMKTNFLNARRQPLRCMEEIAVFYRRQCHFDPPVLKTGAHKINKSDKSQSKNWGGFNCNIPPYERDSFCAVTLLDFPKPVAVSGHPTEKPVDLEEYLVRTYTEPGQVVLDPFMGSGSTGVAAVRAGRQFIGMELSPEYFEMAKRRMEV